MQERYVNEQFRSRLRLIKKQISETLLI